jgi:membrane protein implicated in regulation of membrane protease activity
MIWFLIGFALCLLEALLPTAYVALVAGVAAMIVGFFTEILPFGAQVVLWIGLSALGFVLSRRFVKRTPLKRFDAEEGKTLTEVPAGAIGRVLYEGNSWAAECEDPAIVIPAAMPVWVIGRRGTTLLIRPKG